MREMAVMDEKERKKERTKEKKILVMDEKERTKNKKKTYLPSSISSCYGKSELDFVM